MKLETFCRLDIPRLGIPRLRTAWHGYDTRYERAFTPPQLERRLRTQGKRQKAKGERQKAKGEMRKEKGERRKGERRKREREKKKSKGKEKKRKEKRKKKKRGVGGGGDALPCSAALRCASLGVGCDREVLLCVSSYPAVRAYGSCSTLCTEHGT